MEEGKVNPEVMTSEANEGFLDNQGENGESKEKAGPADKRGHLRICVRRSGSRYVPYPCFRSGWTIHSVIHTHGYFCNYLIFAFMLKKIRKNLVYCLSLQIFKTANLNFTNIKKLQIYLLFKKLWQSKITWCTVNYYIFSFFPLFKRLLSLSFI